MFNARFACAIEHQELGISWKFQGTLVGMVAVQHLCLRSLWNCLDYGGSINHGAQNLMVFVVDNPLKMDENLGVALWHPMTQEPLSVLNRSQKTARWSPSAQEATPSRYYAIRNVERFESQQGGAMWFSARNWSIDMMDLMCFKSSMKIQ